MNPTASIATLNINCSKGPIETRNYQSAPKCMTLKTLCCFKKPNFKHKHSY